MRTVPALPSQRWGYMRIITGTIFGGVLGFYVMHRVETNYKAKWDERLKKYEEEKMRRENTQNQIQDDSLYLADNAPSKALD